MQKRDTNLLQTSNSDHAFVAMSNTIVEKISEVFRTTGQPTVTYVQRKSGNFENRLNNYLDELGQLCLITGPSKTGKTTLYQQVLNQRKEIPLIVQCTIEKKCDDIWKEALEGVNFERVTAKSVNKGKTVGAEAEISTTFGWKWLAGVTGILKGSITKSTSEGEVREKIISKPSPDLLIPILKATNYVLIIEDFHYLDDSQKVLLFQKWKRFVDNGITIIVLGTSHRAVDIANSNLDLVGRISQIDIGHWDKDDLKKICEKGLSYLKTSISSELLNKLCMEAVGLPIIVQQTCLQLFIDENIYSVGEARKNRIIINEDTILAAFHAIANEKYAQFKTYYSTLIRGPRERSRKYRTYEIILACFTIDPVTFSLTRPEIDKRIDALDLDGSEKPPAASLNSTLGALKKFQDKRNFQLLEWRPIEDTLYIVEPSFLFYVRWRNKKQATGEQLDLFEYIISSVKAELRKDRLIIKNKLDIK